MRGDDMTAISATKARENIYQIISDVNANCEPITITNNKGKNAVLIGEADWRAIEETLYLMSIPGMAESIVAGGKTPIEECISEEEVEW
jgi:prevent-host-death family protein